MAPFTDLGRFRSLTPRPRILLAGLGALLCYLLSGCASITNPVVEGIPVRHLPEELLAKPKDDATTIPLDLLGQPQPDAYRLEPKDVLGVYIEGILQDSSKGAPVAINTPPLVQQRDTRYLPPTMGYPVPVRADGTIKLPLIAPLKVQGLSITEAEDAIRQIYLKEKLLPEGRDRIVLTLMYARQTHVVVLRQESSNVTLALQLGPQGAKRSSGHVVDLPAYENDVLHAIAQTGGMPGLDDYNEIIIFRNSFAAEADRTALLEKLHALPPGSNPCVALANGAQAVRIQLRRRPSEPLSFAPQDVILHTGDVVFLEARDLDLFYTGGLLPAAEFILPRDYDLDIVKAIARVRGPLINGAYGVNNLSGNLIQPGLGGPSPSLVTVLRKAPDGSRVPIYVDLDRALKDNRENILVQAGDTLILQEKPSESFSRYMTQTFFNFNVIWNVFRSSTATGVITTAAPDRLANPTLNVNQP